MQSAGTKRVSTYFGDLQAKAESGGGDFREHRLPINELGVIQDSHSVLPLLQASFGQDDEVLPLIVIELGLQSIDYEFFHLISRVVEEEVVLGSVSRQKVSSASPWQRLVYRVMWKLQEMESCRMSEARLMAVFWSKLISIDLLQYGNFIIGRVGTMRKERKDKIRIFETRHAFYLIVEFNGQDRVISVGIDQYFKQQFIHSSHPYHPPMSKMTPQQYQAFKRSLQQTQQKTARMLARIDQTLLGVKDTLNQIKENNDNIEKFERNYNEVMTMMVEKLAASFVNPFKKVPGKEYEHLPSTPPIKQLVSAMLKQEEILLVTGAGVSAASGIPTFRGKGGLYDRLFEWQGQSYSPEEFITLAFYQKHPQAIWKWVEDIHSMAVSCQPNQMHTLIDKLACSLVARGKKVTLVTQNIDDLHLKPSGKTYQYYAIHGNVKFVRCNSFHLSPYQQFREEIKAGRKVNCPQCGGELRPHVLFFDESYGPLYGEEVKGKSFPFVALMGTSLSTGLCSSFAQKAQLLVEINPQPVVEVGKVYQFTGDSVVVLRGVMKELKETKLYS